MSKYLVARGHMVISGHQVSEGDVIEMGDDEVGQLVRQTKLVKLPERIASKIDADVSTVAPTQDLESMTVAELRALLADRDLPTDGKKSELIERLEA